jgi:hypothetical protein
MPLTFAQAYAIVCPDGGTIVPDSKEHRDIMELMRQSGHQHFSEKIATDSAPRKPRTIQEAKRFIETPERMKPTGKVSKREWMSVDANRQAFIKALNKNKSSS